MVFMHFFVRIYIIQLMIDYNTLKEGYSLIVSQQNASVNTFDNFL